MIQNNPYIPSNMWGDGWNNPCTCNTGTQTPNMWGTPWQTNMNMNMNPNMGAQFTNTFGANVPNVWRTPWTNNMNMNPNIGTWIPTTMGTTPPWNMTCNNPRTWMGQNFPPTHWFNPTIPQNTINNPYNPIHGISTHTQQVPINTMNPGSTPWMTTQNNTPWGTYPYGCR